MQGRLATTCKIVMQLEIDIWEFDSWLVMNRRQMRVATYSTDSMVCI